jgi:hypothetical protein
MVAQSWLLLRGLQVGRKIVPPLKRCLPALLR